MASGGGGDNTVKDTPEQKALAKVAAEKWNFAQEELAPLENEYMASVDQMDSASNMSYIRGRTMQAQTQAQGEVQGQLEDGLGKAGVNPNSGRFQGGVNDLGLDLAESGGENLGRAQFEQDNQKVTGMQNITAIGQGQSGRAQAGLSGLARQSSYDAIGDAKNAFSRRSANLQLVGNIAGAGTRYGMEGGASPNQYSMETGAGTSSNNFGLENATGGNYGLDTTYTGQFDYAGGS